MPITFADFHKPCMVANVFLKDGSDYLGVPLLPDIEPPFFGFVSENCAIMVPVDNILRIEVYEP